MSGLFLGIDIGGTATRWSLIDGEGATIAHGNAEGTIGHVFNAESATQLQLTLQQVAQDISTHGGLNAVSLGITGYGDNVADQTTKMVVDALNVSPSAILLTDDMEMAFRTAFAPGQGHLIAAETGSIGLHITECDDFIRVGGRGLLIDDGGSGAWIALTALDRLYRHIDETGGTEGATVLAECLFDTMGGHGWSTTRRFVYGNDRGQIGELAQSVAKAAEKGDPLADLILRDAAHELARLARALVQRAGVRPIGLIGGIVGLHPTIKQELLTTLADLDVTFPQIDVAHYAAEEARLAFVHLMD